LKDRVARKLISKNYEKLNSPSTLIIPSTGNLGISVASLYANKGLKIFFVEAEKRTFLKFRLSIDNNYS